MRTYSTVQGTLLDAPQWPDGKEAQKGQDTHMCGAESFCSAAESNKHSKATLLQ